MLASRDRVAKLERQRESFDCQYAGQYAEMSGSHCPVSDSCQRCRLERAEAEVERLRAILDRVLDANATFEHDGLPREEWDALMLAAEDAVAGDP